MWILHADVKTTGRNGTVIVFDEKDEVRYFGPRIFDALLWLFEQGEIEIKIKGESGPAVVVKIHLIDE